MYLGVLLIGVVSVVDVVVVRVIFVLVFVFFCISNVYDYSFFVVVI